MTTVSLCLTSQLYRSDPRLGSVSIKRSQDEKQKTTGQLSSSWFTQTIMAVSTSHVLTAFHQPNIVPSNSKCHLYWNMFNSAHLWTLMSQQYQTRQVSKPRVRSVSVHKILSEVFQDTFGSWLMKADGFGKCGGDRRDLLEVVGRSIWRRVWCVGVGEDSTHSCQHLNHLKPLPVCLQLWAQSLHKPRPSVGVLEWHVSCNSSIGQLCKTAVNIIR